MATQIAGFTPPTPHAHAHAEAHAHVLYGIRLLLLPVIKHQLDHDLAPLDLGVLQAHFDSAMMTRGARQAVVETLDVSAGDDLSEAAVLRVADLDEVGIEQQDVGAEHGGALGLADKLHDDGAADVTILVDVDGALFVAEQEFLV